MAKTNLRKRYSAATHEGGIADPHQSPLQELKRTVATCLLFEQTHYESGSAIAKRIADLCAQVPPDALAVLAIDARTKLKLRHVPLFLCRQLARYGKGKMVGDTIATVIHRPDELSEFLSLYWKDNVEKHSLSKQVKRGLALAFTKFSGYQLAKWNRDGAVKLRDVMFLVHPKPKNDEQAVLFKQLAEKKLPTPDTWEVALSRGDDKKATWERLLTDQKLGYMALLQNLRNMCAVGVDEILVEQALVSRAAGSWALPFRFITAARHNPGLEPALDKAMRASLAAMPKLPGRTLLVIDVSGSMASELGAKTELTRIDAAAALAILVREIAEQATLYATAGNDWHRVHATQKLPARHGFALSDALTTVAHNLGGGGIFLTQCMAYISEHEPKPFDRVIVFTDEQDCDLKLNPKDAKRLGTYNYLVNVAPYKPSLDLSGAWVRVNGFSERIVDWIIAEEAEQASQ